MKTGTICNIRGSNDDWRVIWDTGWHFIFDAGAVIFN